jgi:site-specific recombinase XerD
MMDIITRWGNRPDNEINYIFPVLSPGMTERQLYVTDAQFIKTTNKYLKRVTDSFGWDLKVTTYFARHSYATRLKRAGVPISYISETLGHSNITTTENYLSGFTDDAVKQNAGLLLKL